MPAEPGEKRVAGGMTEGVVVELEAVEIAEEDGQRLRRGRKRQLAGQVCDQLPAVAETREWIRERVLARAYPAPGHRGTDEDDTEQRERDRKRVEADQARRADAGSGRDDDPLVLGARRRAEPPVDGTKVAEVANAACWGAGERAKALVLGQSELGAGLLR